MGCEMITREVDSLFDLTVFLVNATMDWGKLQRINWTCNWKCPAKCLVHSEHWVDGLESSSLLLLVSFLLSAWGSWYNKCQCWSWLPSVNKCYMMAYGYKETVLGPLTNLLVVVGWGNRNYKFLHSWTKVFLKMYPMRNTQERRNAQKKEGFFLLFVLFFNVWSHRLTANIKGLGNFIAFLVMSFPWHRREM